MSYDHGLFPDMMRTSYITLLCKDKDNATTLKNWRPISLLNYDYKILSKLLANRISDVLDTIVHPDQTCSVRGRSIQDNLHLLRNIIDYVNQKNIPCAFLSLDLEKAFDRVEYSFLFSTLEKFGFGPVILKWLKLCYTDIFGHVLINGFVTDPFFIQRGVKQGCSLSPLLFCLFLEPLARKIRGDPDIVGVKMPGIDDSAKVSLYADDINGILTTDLSIQKFLHWKHLYSTVSGSKLNMKKTKGIWLGKWKSRSDHAFGISWIEKTKILGVLIGNNVSDDDIWHPIWVKIQNTLHQFKNRNLTFTGKSHIINYLVTSKIIYTGSVVLLPKHYLTLFTRAIFQFFWPCKSEPVARAVLHNTKLEGGFGIAHIEAKLHSLYMKHVQRFLNNTVTARWKCFTNYWIGLSLVKYDPTLINLTMPHTFDRPHFYDQCIKIVRDFEKTYPTLSLVHIPKQLLYQSLLKPFVKKPRVISKFPLLDFRLIWNSLYNDFIDPDTRDLSWKIIHGCVPVNFLLHKFRISRTAQCPQCDAIETIDHLFVQCPLSQHLYQLVLPWLRDIVPDLAISTALVRFHILPAGITKYQTASVLYILCTLKQVIWLTRNKYKYDNEMISANFAILLFFNRLKVRLYADFYRFSNITFNDYWGYPRFCTVSDNILTISFPV